MSTMHGVGSAPKSIYYIPLIVVEEEGAAGRAAPFRYIFLVVRSDEIVTKHYRLHWSKRMSERIIRP